DFDGLEDRKTQSVLQLDIHEDQVDLCLACVQPAHCCGDRVQLVDDQDIRIVLQKISLELLRGRSLVFDDQHPHVGGVGHSAFAGFVTRITGNLIKFSLPAFTCTKGLSLKKE